MTASPTLEAVPAPPPAPDRSGLRMPAGAALAAGSLLLVVSPFLTWGEDSGKLSAYARLNDGNLPGESFNGLAASGGSWFGILVLLVGLAGLVASAGYLARTTWAGAVRARFRPELLMVLGLSAPVLALGYLLVQPPDRAIAYSDGLGPLVALVGGVVLLAAALLTAWSTRLEAIDDTPRAPVRLVIGVVIGVVILFVSLFSSWVYDERRQFGTDADTQAEIERLQEEGTAEAAAQATQLLSGGARGDILSIDAFESDGPQLGTMLLVLGVVAFGVALARWLLAGTVARHAKWMLDLVILGLGMAVTLLGAAWVFSFIRTGVPLVVPGVGDHVRDDRGAAHGRRRCRQRPPLAPCGVEGRRAGGGLRNRRSPAAPRPRGAGTSASRPRTVTVDRRGGSSPCWSVTAIEPMWASGPPAWGYARYATPRMQRPRQVCRTGHS